MSTGKYAPFCPYANTGYEFKYNCYGDPVTFDFNNGNMKDYDQKLHYDNYDEEGFDSYGYSCFDKDGNYVGCGEGIDRCGYTEMDYLSDSANGGDLYYDIGPTDMISYFPRKKD